MQLFNHLQSSKSTLTEVKPASSLAEHHGNFTMGQVSHGHTCENDHIIILTPGSPPPLPHRGASERGNKNMKYVVPVGRHTQQTLFSHMQPL